MCFSKQVIKLAVLITTGYAFKEKYIKNLAKDYDHINDPWLPLTIAIIYGCALYGLKRAHVIPAEKLILAFIAVPIIVFFAIVGITGTSMQELREDDWFLTQVSFVCSKIYMQNFILILTMVAFRLGMEGDASKPVPLLGSIFGRLSRLRTEGFSPIL